MNKLKNSKIILVLSILLLFLVIGSASAVDETINETISTPENNGVDTLSQSMDSVDDGVSAAESTDDLVANDTSNQNEMLGLSNDELDVLKASSIDVSTYDQLKDAVANQSISEINIINDITYTERLTITHGDLVINGNGHVLKNTENNRFRFFISEGYNNIQLKNIVFQRSTHYAVQITGNNILINNCSFNDMVLNNRNRDLDYAPLFVNGHDIIINNSNFDNCYCDGSWGRATALTVGTSSYDVTIDNCNFTNNYVIYAYAPNVFSVQIRGTDTTIQNCNFLNNKVLSLLFSQSSSNNHAINCTFINNMNTYMEPNLGGGAICFNGQYCSIESCTFINNTDEATKKGGAIFTSSAALNSVISNCTFINNYANQGGAVYFNGENCNLTYCTFINNDANEGGAVKFLGNNCYMGFCTYINNTATKDGGALCSEAVGSTVDSCEFKINTAPKGPDFYGHNIPISFLGMTFNRLWLTNYNSTNVTIVGGITYKHTINYGYGTDASNPAIWDENALSFLEPGVHCTIYLVDTINNLTQEVLDISDLEIVGYDPVWNPTGGVVDLSGWNRTGFTVNASDVKFTNLTFKNANISGNGGALRIINDDAVIDNCTFMNNTACNGSAISFESGIVLIIKDSTFINNTALGNGTVYMYDDANSTMTLNSTFTDNTAYLGSAIYYAGPVWYYADGLTLTRLNQTTSNKDTYDGTQPYYEPDWNIFTGFSDDYWQRAKLCLMEVYVNLAGNVGTHNGTRDDPTDFGMAFQMVAPTGTIHFVNSSETWNMSKLYNKNEATNYKFGITFEGNNTTVTDYKFINSIYGYDVSMSGFHIVNDDTCVEWKARNGTITNSSFTSKNHVALNVTGENLTICDSSFIDNANGALYVDASGLELSNCTFDNNTLTDDSGVGSHIVLTENADNAYIGDSRFINGTNTGIIVYSTDVGIVGSNFTDNSGVNGGALILSGGSLSMSGNNFTYNKADVDGGAVYLESGVLNEAKDNDFWHNRANNNGGALYTNIPVVIDGGVFFNNTAINGSAIYVTKDNTLSVNNVVLRGNTYTDLVNLDASANFGSIYLNNPVSKGLFKYSGLDLGELQDVWDGTYQLSVIYVNNTGTSSTAGSSPETATSLDNALDHLIDGGKIIFTTDYTVEDMMVNLTNRNLTLTSNNSSSIIRKDSDGKYLFINLK